MTSHIILATSNAPMAEYFESQGFDTLYLGQRSVAAQLLGTGSDKVLSLPEYAQYLKCMRTTTDVKLLAEASYDLTEADSIADMVSMLAECGANKVLIDDSDRNGHPLTLANLSRTLDDVMQRVAGKGTGIILNLCHYDDYGTAGIAERVALAHKAQIDSIALSRLTTSTLSSLTPLLKENSDIGLTLDTKDLNFSLIQALKPAFVLDTYHPQEASNQWVQKTGASVITKLFMG